MHLRRTPLLRGHFSWIQCCPLNQCSTVLAVLKKKRFFFSFFNIVIVEVGCVLLYVIFFKKMIKDINYIILTAGFDSFQEYLVAVAHITEGLC